MVFGSNTQALHLTLDQLEIILFFQCNIYVQYIIFYMCMFKNFIG